MQKILAVLLALVLCPLAFGIDGARSERRVDEVLRELGRSSDDQRRADLIAELGNIRSEPVRLALELVAADDTEAGALRMQAICALGGSATVDSVPLLIAILEKDLLERNGYWACAIPVLGVLKDRRFIALLRRIAALDEEHLAGMEHMAIDAVAAMAEVEDVKFLESKAHIAAVRPAVIGALARIAQTSSAAILATGLLSGEDPKTINAAEMGLRAIGSPARTVLREMIGTQGDAEFDRRANTILNQLR